MMNVNFFVKKKINILPYIAGGIFLLLLLLMSVYFSLTYNGLQNQIKEQNEWISQHTEEVVLARQIRQVDESTAQSTTVQETLRSAQYPMYAVAEELVAAVSGEENRVLTYSMSQSDQLNLTLENITPNQAQSIVGNFEELPYVETVQFLRADLQEQEEAQLRFEMIINLEPEAFPKEETE